MVTRLGVKRTTSLTQIIYKVKRKKLKKEKKKKKWSKANGYLCPSQQNKHSFVPKKTYFLLSRSSNLNILESLKGYFLYGFCAFYTTAVSTRHPQRERIVMGRITGLRGRTVTRGD